MDERFQSRLPNNKPSEGGLVSSGRLNLLSSPVKISLMNTRSQPQNMDLLSHSSIPEDRGDFSVISTQFTTLIDKLSKVYTEIGYSKSDISKNEKKLFTAVSDTFDKFLNDSLEYKETLHKENQEITMNLRLILKILDDPSGNQSIPDLYIRNLVVKDGQEFANLLGRRKSLDLAINYVVTKYKEVMLEYLIKCLELNKIELRIGSLSDREDLQIPNLENSTSICNVFESSSSSSEIYEMVSSDPETFFENQSLNNLSSDKFELITGHIQISEKKLQERILLLKSLSREITDTCKSLEIDASVELAPIYETIQEFCSADSVHENSDLREDKLDLLKKAATNTKQLFEQRSEEKINYETLCEQLWSKLNEDDQYVQTFKSQNHNLSIQCLENYSNEVQRLLELKKTLIKDLILNARQEITDLWDNLFYSSEEREKFTSYFKDTFDDQTLALHEEEIESLKKKYESYKPILEEVQQFKNLMTDKQKLKESSKDSSRLLQRNSHKILMEEEKIRKRLSRQLPKIVDNLRGKLNAFEKEYGYQFLFLDSDLMAQLDEQEKAITGARGPRKITTRSASSQAPTRPTTRPTTRAPSRAPSRAPTRPTTRAPSAQPSRMTSRAPTRQPSPTKPIPSTTSSRYPTVSQGIRKPPVPTYKRPTLSSRPAIQTSQSCIPKLSSPPKDSKLNINSSMIKEHTSSIRRTPTRARTIPTLQRSATSFQPQLSRLDEQTNGSPRARRTRLSPLKESTRSNLPVLSKPNIVTSPLKSLKKDGYSSEEKDQIIEELLSSDNEADNDLYSNWRREQLQKLKNNNINNNNTTTTTTNLSSTLNLTEDTF